MFFLSTGPGAAPAQHTQLLPLLRVPRECSTRFSCPISPRRRSSPNYNTILPPAPKCNAVSNRH